MFTACIHLVSQVHVFIARFRCISSLRIFIAYLRCISSLRIFLAYPCCTSLLHICIAYLYCMSLLHVSIVYLIQICIAYVDLFYVDSSNSSPSLMMGYMKKYMYVCGCCILIKYDFRAVISEHRFSYFSFCRFMKHMPWHFLPYC